MISSVWGGMLTDYSRVAKIPSANFLKTTAIPPAISLTAGQKQPDRNP